MRRSANAPATARFIERTGDLSSYLDFPDSFFTLMTGFEYSDRPKKDDGLFNRCYGSSVRANLHAGLADVYNGRLLAIALEPIGRRP